MPVLQQVTRVTQRPGHLAGVLARACLLLAASFLALAAQAFPTPPGTTISNIAQVSATLVGPPVVLSSNTDSHVTGDLANGSAATITFLQYAPTSGSAVLQTAGPTLFDSGGGTYVTLPDPTANGGGSIDADVPQPLAPTTLFHAGGPVFISVADADHNLSATTIETVRITLSVTATGDSEVLVLTETGPNTGAFTGFVMTSAGASPSGDGLLATSAGSTILASYVDFQSITVSATALVDPTGIVFDAITGAALSGVTVTIVDAVSGLPVTVLGDDGISSFPSSVVTGSSVTDGGGTVYNFVAGEFRFPFVAAGNYRFVVTPIAGYAFPSGAVAFPPGFTVVIGSRGEAFAVVPGPVLHIDVPLDPQTPTGLTFPLTKTAAVGEAAVGDVVGWTLAYANPSATTGFAAVQLVDTLPAGFRYRAGSARLNGAPIADPTISADGLTLTFPAPMAPAFQGSLSYATQVLPNARLGFNVNSVTIVVSGTPQAPPAAAQVKIVEDLFGARSTLVGEVLADACDAAPSKEAGTGPLSDRGVEGVRILMEDGSYALTDSRGRFHFRGVSPGTHVVQLDTASLPEGYEVELCHDDTRHAGNAASQFVDLLRGSLWRADFRVKRPPPVQGLVRTLLKGTLIAAEPGVALYELDLSGTVVPLQNLRASFVVPDGAVLVPDSVVLDGAAVPGAAIADGVLTLRLGDRPQPFAQKIAFRLELPLEQSHELKALLTLDTAATHNLRTPPLAVTLRPSAGDLDIRSGSVLFTPHFVSRGWTLTRADRAELGKLVDKVRGMQSVRFAVVGFTDGRKLLIQPSDNLKDNDDLSRRRAETVAQFLADAAGVPRNRIVVEGRGAREPVGDNARFDGRAFNRRVVISAVGASDPSAASGKAEAGPAELAVTGLRGGDAALPAAVAPAAAAGPASDNDYAPYAKPVDGALLATLEPGDAILWPPNDANPPIPGVKVAVQHRKRETVELTLNGQPVPKTNLGNQTSATDRDVVVTEWHGVDLVDGSNELVATVRGADGVPVATLSRTIHYAGQAVRAELVPERSLLVADGKTRPVIAVRFLDRSGKPVHSGTAGEFLVGAPFRAWRDLDDRRTDKLFNAGDTRNGWQAGADGVALIELAPTTDSGELRLQFRFGPKLAQDLRAWMEPQQRDWVLVGLAEGKLGHNQVDGNVQSFEAAGGAPDYYEDGRVAFYAKGMVKGEYLLTLAYDTGKDRQAGGAILGQDIDPNQYYLLYGDDTEQRSDAASIRNLYVRIERKQFYALFGDFDTGLTLTELGRYSRRMNGLKSEFKGETLAYTAFASEDSTAFVKDEIQGDGTSGLYRLTRQPVVVNSEQVRIQTRDRFHNEQVLSEQVLSRWTDYNVDYTAGTLFFRKPVPSRDSGFNPVFVVVDYEVAGSQVGSVSGGGRGAVTLADGKVEVGATLIHEGVQGAEGDLAAADLRVKLSDQTTLEAEVGSSDATTGSTARDGTAYKVEVEHVGEQLAGRAYLRQQDAGYGLGQQSAGEAGTRKLGVEGSYEIDAQLDATGQAFVQENLATGAERQVAEGSLRYESDDHKYSATGGLRHATDTGLGPTDQTSDQLFAGGTATVIKDLTLRAQTELGLSGDSANQAYPDRLLVGADYRLSSAATLFAEHEISDGPADAAQMSRVGLRTQPWARGRADAAVEQQYSEFGPRLFATIGLGQGFQVNDALLLDFGVDRVHTIRGPSAPLYPGVPPASGAGPSGDFTAYYTGATYRTGDWTMNGRLETFAGDAEDRWGASAGAYRAQGEKMGLAFRLSWLDSEMTSGEATTTAALSFGMAWRPTNPEFLWLDRVDLVYDDAFTLLGGATRTHKLINNLNLNHRPNARWQTSYQYAFKWTRAEFNDSYTSFTDLIGIDSRYDLTAQWDIGGQLYGLHEWQTGTLDWSAGLSLGHSFAKNVWLSFGYNFAGFDDEDFAQARYTAAGPFIQFRIKFDQDSLRDLSRLATAPLAPPTPVR